MKDFLSTLTILILLVFSNSSYAAEEIPLDLKSFHEINFDGIKKTKYQFSKNTLEMTVNKSSSALVLPLKKITTLERVSFLWKTKGQIKTKSAKHETTKSGDDFPLRIGLCISGKAPMVPFFAPAWIKKIKNILFHPSDHMEYLIAGSKHQPLSSWKSPYSSSMRYIALPNKLQSDGWNLVDHKFKKEIIITALWVMADGDNTKSTFTTYLKNLFITKKAIVSPKNK